MMDQAEKLRQMIGDNKLRQDADNQHEVEKEETKKARVITVTSGKGGVGKTNVTVNLAVALSEMGLRVVILDADFGLANIDLIYGVVPKYTIAELISGEKNVYEVLSDGPNNVKFIAGGSGIESLTELNQAQIDKFIENISLLDRIFDIILIDTGAGISESVMSFVMAADEVILVTTPEPTSMMDAYALIKMVAGRDKNKEIKIVVNRAENINEANAISERLTTVSERFLNIKLKTLGYILFDEAVIKSVKQQQPFLTYYPRSHAAKMMREISRKMTEYNNDNYMEDKNNSGIKGFMSRFVRFLGK